MANEEPTIPPRQPNTPRVWLGKAWRLFAALDPVYKWGIGGVIVGLILPLVARAIFG